MKAGSARDQNSVGQVTSHPPKMDNIPLIDEDTTTGQVNLQLHSVKKKKKSKILNLLVVFSMVWA